MGLLGATAFRLNITQSEACDYVDNASKIDGIVLTRGFRIYDNNGDLTIAQLEGKASMI